MTKIVKKSKNKNGREIEQKKTFNKDRNVKNMSHIMISKKKKRQSIIFTIVYHQILFLTSISIVEIIF